MIQNLEKIVYDPDPINYKSYAGYLACCASIIMM
jgi:hypothetical protein